MSSERYSTSTSNWEQTNEGDRGGWWRSGSYIADEGNRGVPMLDGGSDSTTIGAHEEGV
jgi:hypothetical protein